VFFISNDKYKRGAEKCYALIKIAEKNYGDISESEELMKMKALNIIFILLPSTTMQEQNCLSMLRKFNKKYHSVNNNTYI